MSRLSSAALLALLASCVQVTWERHEVQTEIAEDEELALVDGEADLGACLESFGAPLYVWEHDATSIALAYGWDKQREYGVSVSLPVADTGGSASFNYNDVASRLFGVVLIFDQHGVLERKQRGYLRQLIPGEALRRPAYLEDE